MPKLIPHAFELAIECNRDVILVAHVQRPDAWAAQSSPKEKGLAAWRSELTDWLNDEGIGWDECWLPGVERNFIEAPRELAAIYVDLAHDVDDLDYRRVIARFEHPDGTSRDENMACFIYKLESALKDARAYEVKASTEED